MSRQREDQSCKSSQLQEDEEDEDGDLWGDASAVFDGESEFADPNVAMGVGYDMPVTKFDKFVAKDSCNNIADKTSDAVEDHLALHRAVFENDVDKIHSILANKNLIAQRDFINRKDKHGNTALHLACMLGRSRDVVSAFLQNDIKWSIDVKNLNRWTPFHEACSYGNRDVIMMMAKQLKDDVDEALVNSKISSFLQKTKNYRLVLKWEFQSWVPFVSRILPSDVCVINKQGKNLRIDTALLDFEGLFRKKGDSCLIHANKKWIVKNNSTKKFQYFETPSVCRDLEDRVDEFMSSDLIDIELKSSAMQLTRSRGGWIWKADKVGKVGRYNVSLYELTNVFILMRKRREHLSEEDLKRNKSIYKNAVQIFKSGEAPPSKYSDDEAESDTESASGEGEPTVHRESLAPPPSRYLSWDAYIGSEPGRHPCLGREIKCKVSKTAVKASVAMSEEFPLTKSELLNLLSVIPIKIFSKLKDFVEMKLPNGFPVRLDIPIFPLLSARITFEDFKFIEGPIDENLFSIPPDFEEVNDLLPSKFRSNKRNEFS